MLADVLSALLRGMGFVAVLQAGGAALFLVTFGNRVDVARRGILRLIRISALAAAGLLFAQYLLEPARMAGTLAGIFDVELQTFAIHTRAAFVLALRLVGVLLLLWGLRAEGAGLRRFGIAGAVLIALSFPMIGHSAEGAERWLLMPLLALHLLVVEFWFGSLLPLVLVGEHEPVQVSARIVERFSAFAGWLVPLIFVAGLLLAVFLLPGADALLGTYGMGLILKTLSFAVLMALAASNKWQLGPALLQGGHQAVVRLRRSIGVEYVLIVLVLLGTASLTTFWSPGS